MLGSIGQFSREMNLLYFAVGLKLIFLSSTFIKLSFCRYYRSKNSVRRSLVKTPILVLSTRYCTNLEHKSARPSREREIEQRSRETRNPLAPLHQTPSHRIALLFAVRARDSKASPLAD